METNIFKYVWRYSRREQILTLFLVLVSLPFYFLSLDLPKQIVNDGIQGESFKSPETKPSFFKIEVPFTGGDGEPPVVLFDGIDLEQADYLIALSLVFLLLVIINGLFKFVINTMKGRMGERMLRRLRYELSDRILRFPLGFIRRVKSPEMASMINAEVEPLGGFIGDAFVTPVFLGGQALTAMIFIMVQSFWLGLIAMAVVLVQAFLIPKLRKPILRLGKERNLTARQLAGRIGEVVDGTVEIHAHDTSNFERADLAARLGKIFGIRFEIYQRKFFVKFLNNFLAQLTPFIFYSLGGILAIRGSLDIGALVAVIAAYKDLPGPIKELIDWDQRRLDIQIKYTQVIEQFQPPDILDPALQDVSADPGPKLSGTLSVENLALVDENDSKLVDAVSFSIDVNEHVALVGASGSGKEQIAYLLARLMRPTSGRIRLNGTDIATLPEAITGRRLSYVGQDVYLFPTSVRDNLLYGLKHLPLVLPTYTSEEVKQRRVEEEESLQAGNTTLDRHADWVDYEAAGVSEKDEIVARLVEVLHLTELDSDVYRFGLAGSVDPKRRPEVVKGILAAREAILERLADLNAADFVVRFDPLKYNRNATLAENLLFGTPTKAAYNADQLAQNTLLVEVMDTADLSDDLFAMGKSIAKTMVELFADLPPGHPFFDQFSFISSDDLPDFKVLVARVDKVGEAGLEPEDRLRLRRLPFNYIEARHRLGLVDEVVEAKVLRARELFSERLSETDPGAVEFYRPDAYNAAASLQDNILFGRLAYGKARGEESVGKAVAEVLDQLDLRHAVIEVGLDHQVGIGGKRLTAIQRQKLGMARALLKRPDLLFVNEALAVMDGATQGRLLEGILASLGSQGVVWTLQRASEAKRFDRVLVFEAGRLVAQGTFAELNQPGTRLSELVAAD